MIRKDRTTATPTPARPERRTPRSVRMRVFAAFRALGHGVDPQIAREQTEAFYRSGGAEWTRRLG